MNESQPSFLAGGAKRPLTATEHVVARLRDAIASGELREGEQLRQNEIAAALGVSRTPVRESLRILEAEGWLEFSPHRGAVVATLSGSEIRQIFEIRFALESLALRNAVPKLTDADLASAEDLIAAMDAAPDIAGWVRLNRAFHLSLYTGAGARLRALIEAQYDAVDRYLRLELVAMGNAEESQDEHRAILAACRAHDVEKAVALYATHIAEAGEDLSSALEARKAAT